MEISNDKSKLLVNDPDPNKGKGNNFPINIHGTKLEKVKSFKYIGIYYNTNIINKRAIRITTATSIMIRYK